MPLKSASQQNTVSDATEVGSVDPRETRILIVDNDAPHAEAVAETLERVGYQCRQATSGSEAAALLRDEVFDVVLTDLVMTDLDGLQVLKIAKEELVECEVILMTGHGSVPSAVHAMQQGAFNYLLKPLDMQQLRAVIAKAADNLQLRKTNRELQARLDERFGFEGVVGSSVKMNEVVERLKRIAPTDATVLIQGATGTGKELVAQAIHQNSPRKNKRFVALNCAALSANILESELFGHVKGAFTDASSDRMGKFEYASGGTLFLDEVGDMPLATQIKLLRVLENSEITRLGSNDPIKVNVRILSATNRNLEHSIATGQFREDLYHRIKVVTIYLPGLAERYEDIPLLMEHFIRLFSKRHHKQIKGIATPARRKLLAHAWPGNVRELRNVIEGMVVVDVDGVLDVDDLDSEWSRAPGGTEDIPTGSGGLSELIGKPLEEVERLLISETLKVTGGNREEAATMLGIGERTLYRKLREMEGQTG